MGFDVAVIGGGAVGASIAYHAARAGAAVVLLERDALAAGASGVAAGLLAPHEEVVQKSDFFHLGNESLSLFPALAAALREESGLDVELSICGNLVVATSEARARELQETVRRQAVLGIPSQWLDRKAVLELEPHLSPAVEGAALYPEEGHVAPARLTAAFARVAAQRGAVVREGALVTGFVTRGQRVEGVRLGSETIACRQAVIAAGPWSAMCAQWLGVAFPVFPVKGQLLAIDAPPGLLRHIVFSQGHGYLTPKADGALHMGGTSEPEAGFDRHVTAGATLDLLAAAIAVIPALRERPIRFTKAGLRPGSADGLPLMGPVPGWEGVAIAAGHYRNGILLSPITGALVARFLAAGEVPPLMRPFLPDRFPPSPP